MQTFFRIILVLIILLIIISFKPHKKEKIKWISLAELKTAYSSQAKPILIDVYTNWCGWCKEMDKKTYGNGKVAEYINEHFYAVKFNAETKDSVYLGALKFGYDPAYKTNNLALYLLSGVIGYPTTVLLSSIDARPAPLSGYLKPSELEPPVKYFGDGAFMDQDFTTYMKNFNGSW